MVGVILNNMILGIDEVGRGPWAGPLVVGAVVLGNSTIDGLTDSKKLSAKRRLTLDELIRKTAAGYGLGWVHANEIDEIGLPAALKLATIRAVEQVSTPYSQIIVDGTINFLKDTGKGRYVTTMKKADLLIPAVSAASIIAKVARDTFMAEQDNVYPGYNFTSHVGYGTVGHRQAIQKLGVTPLHRLSYAPLAQYKTQVAKTTKRIGDDAEDIAAYFLETKGHTILERNWKTKFCEIDIISLYNNTIYFTEVKYRNNHQQGGGLAAITKAKLQQMTFAAQAYADIHNIKSDVRLAVISLSGKFPTVDDYLVLD